MRRLLLALLLVPISAHADTPVTMLTPWYGCASTGNCFTVVPEQFGDGTAGLVIGRAYCAPDCTVVPAGRIFFFDSEGNDVGHLFLDGDPRPGVPYTAVTGVMQTTWFGPELGTGPTTTERVVFTTTPEPVAMTLMATGLVVVGLVRRRRHPLTP